LSDNIGFLELFGKLVDFMLNEKCRKLLIYQDNTSVIEMVVSRGGVTRTKHMRTRMHLVLEAVKENRIEIKYIGAKEMRADGFTKSLHGMSFVQFRSEVLHLTD
jgi:ribosome maturation protein Sdo1